MSGPAIAKYGQKGVDAAVKEMLKFGFDTGWNPRLIVQHADQLTRAQVAPILGYLTPAAAKTFQAALAKVLSHDPAAIRALEGAVFFGVIGPNHIRPVVSANVVTDRTYSQVAVGVDKTGGVERMSVSFTAKANIHMQDAAGKAYVLPTSRKVHYLLVPNTGSDAATKPFLIARWANRMTASRIKQVG